MNSDELDSQLSAMFDDELPAEQCELLARRLARDEALKARWGRYAAIGAAMRSERGVALSGALAQRVSAAIASEPSLLSGGTATGAPGRGRFSLRRLSQPILGAAVAASVAAGAILWLRAQSPLLPLHALPVPTASLPGSTATALIARAQASAAAPAQDSYTVPAATESSSSLAPPTELANFVVFHSQFSAPFLRRHVLSSLMGTDSAVSAQPRTQEASERVNENRTPNADATH
jgi:negative regulator of sigma E activity